MSKKKATKKKTPPKKDKGLNPKQKLFCQYFAGGIWAPEVFGNATKSYIYAYGYLEQLDKLWELKERNKDYKVGKRATKKDKKMSEIFHEAHKTIDDIYRLANASGNRLLVNVSITKELDKTMDKFLSDKTVDRELVFVATQRSDLKSKVSAIKEYNAVRGRVKQRMDLTSKDKELVGPIYLPVKMKKDENKTKGNG